MTILLRVYAVFSQFSAAGIAVHSFDAHGHGRSEPSRPDDRCLVQNYIDLVQFASIFTFLSPKHHTSTIYPHF